MRHVLGHEDDRDQVAGVGAVDVLLRVGSSALPQIQAQEVGLAGSEDELDALLARKLLGEGLQLREQLAPAKVLHHHAALAHRHRLEGYLVQEGAEPVLTDLALREGPVPSPAEPRRPDHLALAGGVEDPAAVVLGLDEETVLVVGDAGVAAHLLDVDVVAEAIDGAPLCLGLGEVDAWSDQPSALP
jgi:hypothetical protein